MLQIPRYASLMYVMYLLGNCVGHSIHQIFLEKKDGKDQNLVSCTEKKKSLSLVSTRNDNISRGCATKMELPEEGRGVHFVS